MWFAHTNKNNEAIHINLKSQSKSQKNFWNSLRYAPAPLPFFGGSAAASTAFGLTRIRVGSSTAFGLTRLVTARRPSALLVVFTKCVRIYIIVYSKVKYDCIYIGFFFFDVWNFWNFGCFDFWIFDFLMIHYFDLY